MWTEKYNPTTLDDLIGNPKTITALKNIVSNKNEDIPNMLFYGKAGTGKTSAAILLMHEILRDGFDGNVIEVNASNNRGIDTMRELVKATKHMPLFAPYKFIFLDEADGMTSEAQDMLKKPLEPSKNQRTRFILCCNSMNLTLPLISRCMVFEFKPLSNEDIANRLDTIAHSEGVNVDRIELHNIATEANGDLRAAITALEQHNYSSVNQTEEYRKVIEQYT